jgi:hypothetical protein
LTGGTTNNRYARHILGYVACSDNGSTISGEWVAEHNAYSLNIFGNIFTDTSFSSPDHGGQNQSVASATAYAKSKVGVPFGLFVVGATYPDTIRHFVQANGVGWRTGSGSYWVWS